MTIEGRALQDTVIGRELTLEQCNTLALICEHLPVANGQLLFAEGSRSDHLFIVASGRFAVSRDTGRGFSDTLHLLGPGDLAGESGFLDGSPHSASLRAVGDATVLTIQRSRLEGLLIDNPIIVYKVMRAIVYSIREIIRRMNQQQIQMMNYINPGCGRF
ncbi:MAG: cyclic nucleotide-binding domain-containing protein [Halothiobacillus sp.]|jgi:CRP/FNR family cyclic AMP-dependent transcriptional regulator|nr:cyclic nucleotide-binding domain-containing protein [Halothiobacillus sp.]